MRLINALIALVFVLLGVVFAALNRHVVTTDFGLITLHASLGLSLLAAVLLGALIGGAFAALGTLASGKRPVGKTASTSEAAENSTPDV